MKNICRMFNTFSKYVCPYTWGGCPSINGINKVWPIYYGIRLGGINKITHPLKWTYSIFQLALISRKISCNWWRIWLTISRKIKAVTTCPKTIKYTRRLIKYSRVINNSTQKTMLLCRYQTSYTPSRATINFTSALRKYWLKLHNIGDN